MAPAATAPMLRPAAMAFCPTKRPAAPLVVPVDEALALVALLEPRVWAAATAAEVEVAIPLLDEETELLADPSLP